MSLINEHYAGYRLERWDQQTDVTFNITHPENPSAIPEPHIIMSQNPTFGSLDTPTAKQDRETLVSLLKNGATLVTFKTADGDAREMICTQNEQVIPVSQHPKKPVAPTLQEVAFTANPAATVPAVDQNLFKVYAIDRQGWRSFRFERVIKFTPYQSKRSSWKSVPLSLPPVKR